MKGLLLKEWYLMRKSCRAYLFITAVFLAVSAVSDNSFFVLYPCLLCGMIPINLQSLDERSGWTRYSGALPYTKAQLVSVKYLSTALVTLVVLALTAAVQSAKLIRNGAFRPESLLMMLLAMFLVAAVSVSLYLPIIFYFGTEKGRIISLASIVVVGIFFGTFYAVSADDLTVNVSPYVIYACLFVGGCALYALSWALSAAIYGKRE